SSGLLMNKPIPTILHVDDDPNDRLLVATAFRHVILPLNLRAEENVEKSLEYLAGTGAYSNRDRYPFPALVLLDLRLPRKSGLEVLAWIRDQPDLQNLPVVILSSSAQESDTLTAWQMGVNGYFSKPVSLAPLRQIVAEICSKWLASGRDIPSLPTSGNG
ncbi:MAG: two-component system response regulator, partial [Pedosphaera sp.]|nr:two-component system response regulator [Pedosphaera sp.]